MVNRRSCVYLAASLLCFTSSAFSCGGGLTWEGGQSENALDYEDNWCGGNMPGVNDVGRFRTTDNQPVLRDSMEFAQNFRVDGVVVTLDSLSCYLTSLGITNSPGVTSTFNLTSGALFELDEGFLADGGVTVFNLDESDFGFNSLDGSQANDGLVRINLASGSSATFSQSATIEFLSSSSDLDVIVLDDTLTLGNSDNQVIEAGISGAGGLIKVGSGKITLSNFNTYSGGTEVLGGTVAISAGRNLGNPSAALTLSDGSLSWIGSGSLSGPVFLSGSGNVISVDLDQIAEMSGAFMGTVPLTKSGEGILYLSGVKEEGIALVVTQGTLKGTTETLTGNVSGSGTVVFSQSEAGVSLANISGSNAVSIELGAIAFQGNYVYTGPTTIENGSILLRGSSSLETSSSFAIRGGTFDVSEISGQVATIQTLSGYGTILLGNKTLRVVQNLGGVSSIDIEGSGSFVKEGPGMLICFGDSSYTGSTSINEGVFVLLGQLASSVEVGSNATFRGVGTVLGNVVVHGVASPGGVVDARPQGAKLGVSAPLLDVLTIEGDYTQASGSTLEIEISPSSSTGIVASGLALIQDATTLNVVVDPGVYGKKTYTLLSGSQLNGQFANFTIDPSLIAPYELIYGSTSLSLLVKASLSGGSNSGNTRQVAKALDEIVLSDPDAFGSLLDPLYFMGSKELNAALNTMQPSLFKGFAIAQESSSVRVQESLSYRLLNELDCKNCCEEKKPFHVWVDGLGNTLSQNSTEFSGNQEIGYQEKMAGFSLGADYRFGCLYAGVLGAYTGSSLHFKEKGGHGAVNSGYGGLYFSALTDIWYANASVIGSWSSYSSHRRIHYTGVNKTASNTHAGAQLLSHLDTGINWGMDFGFFRLTARPFDAFNYITQNEHGFKEEGAGPFDLSVAKNTSILLRNELGLDLAACFSFTKGRFVLTPKASWIREVRVKGSTYTAEFIHTDGDLTVLGFFPNRGLFSPGISAAATLLDQLLTLELYYNGEFTHGYSNHSYGGQARFSF